MAQTRFVRIFEGGELVGQESYEVSDEQLGREADDKALAELNASPLGSVWGSAKTETAIRLVLARLYEKGILP